MRHFNWRKHLQVTAVTTEERLWEFVKDQARELFEVAGQEKWNLEKKKQAVEAPYNAIREAFKQLGVIR